MLLFCLGILLLIGGLWLLRTSLDRLFSQRMSFLLSRLTTTPWRGFCTGSIAAMLLQGSTAVSLLTIGLVSSGYLTFTQSVGILLGANVGTCTTIQFMTLAPPDNALLPVLITTLILSAVLRRLRFLFLAPAGFMMMFQGLSFLSDGLTELSQLSNVLFLLQQANELPLWGILGGILITFLFQSASASTILLMGICQDGLLSLSSVCFAIYGNNIGSCLSSVLVSTAAPLAAKKTAAAHLILNLGGTLIFYPLTPLFLELATWFSSDLAMQIAFLHTAFNIICSAIVLPFTKRYAAFISSLFPQQK